MTPRQRVLSAIAYGRLKRHLGIETGHNRVYDVVQQLSQPEDDILERFGIDAVDLGRTSSRPASRSSTRSRPRAATWNPTA
jgi:hypothetical protein